MPDMVAGHSYGELVALHAAGVLDARRSGRALRDPGAAAAATRPARGPARWRRCWPGRRSRPSSIDGVPGVRIVNWNGPRQTVIAGDREAVARVLERAASEGDPRPAPARRVRLPHAPDGAAPREPLARLAATKLRGSPDRPVYSNLDAAPHPADAAAIAAPPGRARREPRPVRRDDRGDVRRRGAGLRRGRAGRRPHLAGRLDPRRPAAPGRGVRSARTARDSRAALGAGAAPRGGRAAEARGTDAGPIRYVARSRGTAERREFEGPWPPPPGWSTAVEADRWARPSPGGWARILPCPPPRSRTIDVITIRDVEPS